MSRQVNSGDPSSGYPSKVSFEQKGAIADADLTVIGVKDQTKQLVFDVSGQTTGKTITIAAGANSANITLTLPTTSGTLSTGTASVPGGSTTQVQYNNAGAFAGDAGFVYTLAHQSVAIGSGSSATGASSMVQGDSCTASGDRSHAQGNTTSALGNNSHSEGLNSIAAGLHSHAEGNGTQANGISSHVEGVGTIANNEGGHAEGNATLAQASFSHAEGNNTICNGNNSHAEGNATTADNDNSHAQNNSTFARGSNSDAAGLGTYAQGYAQTTVGYYNVKQGNDATIVSGDSVFIVGNGVDDSNRHNAFAVLNTGESRIYGSTSGYVGLVAPAAPTNHTIQLPSAQGTGALSNNGSGVLSYVQTLVFTSAAGAGGAATEAMTVTGILSSDTILAVTQKTKGGNSLPLLGYSTLGNNTLTGIWSADPGSGSVIIVAVKR